MEDRPRAGSGEQPDTAPSRDRTELVDELADLSEVMKEMMRMTQITPAEVEKRRREKETERGGFGEGWILERREV